MSPGEADGGRPRPGHPIPGVPGAARLLPAEGPPEVALAKFFLPGGTGRRRAPSN